MALLTSSGRSDAGYSRGGRGDHGGNGGDHELEGSNGSDSRILKYIHLGCLITQWIHDGVFLGNQQELIKHHLSKIIRVDQVYLKSNRNLAPLLTQ